VEKERRGLQVLNIIKTAKWNTQKVLKRKRERDRG
jgi:hypothetical protein